MTTPETLPDEIDALKAALLTERAARQLGEARASGAEAMVAHLKLMIAKLRHGRFGASSERSRKLLDQMELELEELQASAAEDASATTATEATTFHAFTRRPGAATGSSMPLSWTAPASGGTVPSHHVRGR